MVAPIAEGKIQIVVDTKKRPRTLLIDAIDLGGERAGTRLDTISADTNVASKGSHASSIGICPLKISNPTNKVVDASKSRSDVLSEGRTKRCLYLFASCCVDDPYRGTYDLNSRFRAMEVTMSAMHAASTNSGLIFTPSVSSSKKRRSPALDAGNGAFFFLLLILGTIYLLVQRP